MFASVIAILLWIVLLGCGSEAPPTKSHLLNGDYYVYKKEYQKALDEYSKEVDARTPNAPLAAAKRWVIFDQYVSGYKNDQDVKLYQKYAKESVELKSDDRYAKSLKDYNALIAEKPQAYLYVARAWVLEASDNFGDAIADYNKAIELDPKNAENYIACASAYGDNNDQNG